MLSANIPTICGITIPPNAAIASNMDIPMVEPLMNSPAFAIQVGYIPAKKKPKPATAVVMITKFFVEINSKKNIVAQMQFININFCFDIFLET